MLIASFCNLQIGKMPARRHQAPRIHQRQRVDVFHFHVAFASQRFLHRFYNLVIGCGSQHRIHFRNLIQNLLLVSLRQAAGHNQHLKPSIRLVLCHLQNRLDALFLGVMDETAGIDDNDIRLHLIIHHPVSFGSQKSQHNF